jgi:hypothetical protein
VSEPCLCGAPDCYRCFPGNFDGYRYKYRECDKCGEEYAPGEDESLVCEDCAKLQECKRCHTDYDSDDCVDPECELCPECEAERCNVPDVDAEDR